MKAVFLKRASATLFLWIPDINYLKPQEPTCTKNALTSRILNRFSKIRMLTSSKFHQQSVYVEKTMLAAWNSGGILWNFIF